MAAAQTARFDLPGPRVEIRVTRSGVTLPIAAVPNLQGGDQLWLRPDLPETQSVRYLMVVVFLRGTTNPPPDTWFVRIETWNKTVRMEGQAVTVPKDAQQAVLLLAPVTGGDFSTLRSAVQGRPGIFVRAAQDLDLAGFEQARIETYIDSMRRVPAAELSDPKALLEHSNMIAGTLALKPNGECVKLPPEQQYTCLTQTGSQTLLDDGHGVSIISAISSGAGSDFINAASATSLAGSGVYSAYVGAIVDLVRIMGSLHTAHYQYIPAIAFPDGAALNLRLNVAPSFHDPKSVIVIGLPSVLATSAPPLRPRDPKLVSCLARPGLALPMEGAPLVFSTGFAHEMILHLNYPDAAGAKDARPQDIPLTADAYKGGLVLGPAAERRPLPLAKVTLPTLPGGAAARAQSGAEGGGGAPPGGSHEAQGGPREPPAGPHELTGTIEGLWGFDRFTGPTIPIQSAPGRDWRVVGGDPLIAGADAHVLLRSTGTACVERIELEGGGGGAGQAVAAEWRPGSEANTVDAALKLSEFTGRDPGALKLAIRQFGAAEDATIGLTSYTEPAKLSGLHYHAGDRAAVLAGTNLEQVKQVRLGGGTFVPAGSAGAPPGTLVLAPEEAAPAAAAGETLEARVTLKDGRTLSLGATVEAARPKVTLIHKAASGAWSGGASGLGAGGSRPEGSGLTVKPGSPDDLSLGDTLSFSLRSEGVFPRDGRLEVASADGGFRATLTVASGTLAIEDPHIVVARLEPLKQFGASAFGPVRVRAVAPDGSAGDWIPLATLVRLPRITGIACAAAGSSGAAKGAGSPAPGESPSAAGTCRVTGSELYLIDSLGPEATLAEAVRVPEGFVGDTLAVPAPTSGVYFLRLRDDPSVAASVVLPGAP